MFWDFIIKALGYLAAILIGVVGGIFCAVFFHLS